MNSPVDALIHHMRGFAASQNAWEAGFAKSVLKQSGRRGWRPTPKQTEIMQRLVAELFNEIDCEVIEK